jgi:hypothetical protein
MSPDDVFNAAKAGNERFQSGKHASRDALRPARWVGCSDEYLWMWLTRLSRYWFDEHPEVDVGDEDKTLDEYRPGECETGYFGRLENALEEWLLDGEVITERQYRLVAGDEDAREEIPWDLMGTT